MENFLPVPMNLFQNNISRNHYDSLRYLFPAPQNQNHLLKMQPLFLLCGLKNLIFFSRKKRIGQKEEKQEARSKKQEVKIFSYKKYSIHTKTHHENTINQFFHSEYLYYHIWWQANVKIWHKDNKLQEWKRKLTCEL